MGGRLLAKTGMSNKVRTKVKAKRMRGGMTASPMPGMIIKTAPIRANIKLPCQTRWDDPKNVTISLSADVVSLSAPLKAEIGLARIIR